MNSSLTLLEYFCIETLGLTAGEGSYFSGNHFVVFLFLSDCIVLAISLVGVSVTIVLKYWLLENQELNRLEKRRIEMEVEQVKEQISSSFLFRILHTTGDKAETEPQQASAMLLHLSRLLRYQLYDGIRQQVLLSSEIQFITTYMLLEQNENSGFKYQITTKGEISHVIIPPLLFLPLIQEAIKKWKENNNTVPLLLFIEVTDDNLGFRCNCLDWPHYTDECRQILLKRIKLLFPDRFRIENQTLLIEL